MLTKLTSNLILFVFLTTLFLNSCANRGDARKSPPNPKERVKKNLEEGRGFRLMDSLGKNSKGGGEFDFATSNELWRATLDTIDFIPLASANYGGGIIITDWYSSGEKNESIKISIRFLSNEVRSDALNIKVFYKKCGQNESCAVTEKSGTLVTELNKKILSKAAIYSKQNKDKNIKPYKGNMTNK